MVEAEKPFFYSYGERYLLTYLLTPWSRVLLEKLTGSAVSQEIPRIFKTRRFLTVLTSARQLSLSWANSIQSPQPPPTSWRFILILSSHLRLGLSSGLFPSGFPTRTLCTPLPFPIRATCPAKNTSSCNCKISTPINVEILGIILRDFLHEVSTRLIEKSYLSSCVLQLCQYSTGIEKLWYLCLHFPRLDIIRKIKEDKMDGTCGTYEQVYVRIRSPCVLKPEWRKPIGRRRLNLRIILE